MKPFANEEEEFQAYVDHRLPAEQAAAWAARVRDEPELAARVNAYRAQNAALHSLFDPVLDEPSPATWQVVPPAPHRPWLAANQPAWHMVAGVLLMVLGGLSGWLAHAWWQPQPVVAALPRQAAIAHVVYSPDVRRPVRLPHGPARSSEPDGTRLVRPADPARGRRREPRARAAGSAAPTPCPCPRSTPSPS